MHDNAATIQQGLADNGYVADRSLATTLALMDLEVHELSEDVEVVRKTLACIIKTREDRSLLDEQAFAALLARATPAAQTGSPPLS